MMSNNLIGGGVALSGSVYTRFFSTVTLKEAKEPARA